MRFLANGPSIPDDLLLARDQGRVIFFCGAGVSRARAKLPDFFGLARSVVAKLGVDQNGPACKLIEEAQEIDRRVGVSGVISADRVFGLLERDFSPRDIEEAVASSLKPPPACDLTAHNILLDLATTPLGAVQLVTTNFDRLFDDCGRGLQNWQPPKLPDPLRPAEINGIVYLHGRATPDYFGAEGDGFILSSSAFGRAYLSDGWATSFIREILQRYVVVFVGYTADDPPVQYLLEALRRASEKQGAAYAFQSGDHDDAAARWRHKGVEAIPYSPDSDHAALWQTLEAWSGRARDPDAWYANVINASRSGPPALRPHERGQVAHIVSTYEGAKKFSSGDNPPPAEWLCVFDRHRRFARPGRSASGDGAGPYVDPFVLYGLDSDIPPRKFDHEDHYSKREAPTDAWDAFELNRLDRSPLRDENLAGLRGHWAGHSPTLVPRIAQLGLWLARVCAEPAAVWWAAHQSFLHESIRDRISWQLERGEPASSPEIRRAWRSLLERWTYAGDEFHRDWFSLQAAIKNDGWTSRAVRQLGELLRPRISVESSFWGGPTPPTADADPTYAHRLMRMDIKYPDVTEKINIPDEWCSAVLRELRRNLELAVFLENEIGGYGLSNISPITPAGNDQADTYHRKHGLSAAVILFTELFSQLAVKNKAAAIREFASWPLEDDTVFARLRIWAAKDSNIVPGRDFVGVIASLSDSAFWNSYHQRDLLLTLSGRWRRLVGPSRRSIEERVINGPKRWKREKRASYESRKSWSILGRFQWLEDSGCKLSASIRRRVDDLREATPDWKAEFGAKAAESMEGRVGWVRTNTDHEELSQAPLASTLQRARELSGRSSDFLVENDPYAGLAAQKPIRAFAALKFAAGQGDFSEWAWRTFLNSQTRKSDKARLSLLIGERVARYTDEHLALIIRPLSDWFRDASVNVNIGCLPTFEAVLVRLIDVLKKNPDEAKTGVVRGLQEPDWAMEAINSPTGRIAEGIFKDPRIVGLPKGQGFPQEWIEHVESLLALPNELYRNALVILFHNLNWFYFIDPDWTDSRLLSILHRGETDDCDAAWSGFLWSAMIPSRELYVQLKDDLLKLAVDRLPLRRSYGEVLAGIILSGWGTVDDITGKRIIADEEMRRLLLNANEDFHSQILWQVQRWSKSEQETRWDDQIVELLRIWPRQMSARTSNISLRLCEIAFSSGDRFPVIARLILPLLTKIERDHMSLPELGQSGADIVDRYPKLVLSLLYSVLPENASAWPYGIEGTLMKIGEVDATLERDGRLIELRRRWDAR